MCTAVKGSLDSLALFGGEALFATPRPIGQLAAPDVDAYLALLKQAFEVRWLANGGPLVQRLERRLAEFHGTRHCIAVANAGLGITMLLQIFAGGRRGEVIMPAFSYPGLPHFARWAGQEPRFCEVEEGTHALDPTAVAKAIAHDTTAVLAVCNCHSPGDIDALCRVAAGPGIPIVFDSVNALGASYRGRRLGGSGCAEVYSTHATKLLNGFEGGYITTDDDDLAAKLCWQRNFCIPALRPSCVSDSDVLFGVNAKLNELHAAMALLSLDRFNEIVGRNEERFAAYRGICSRLPGLRLLTATDHCYDRQNHLLIVAEFAPPWPLTRDQTLAVLRAEGMKIAPYYSPPLHRSSHASLGLPVPELPVAEALAARFLQLPSGELVSLDDISEIGALLEFMAANGAAISSRLTAGSLQ